MTLLELSELLLIAAQRELLPAGPDPQTFLHHNDRSAANFLTVYESLKATVRNCQLLTGFSQGSLPEYLVFTTTLQVSHTHIGPASDIKYQIGKDTACPALSFYIGYSVNSLI